MMTGQAMPPLSFLILLAFAPPDQPGAFALLEEARRAYRALSSYADSGEIVVETAGGAEARFHFETRYHSGRGSYLLERLGERSPDVVETPAVWAVWQDEAGAFLYDGSGDSYRPVESVGTALTEMLGVHRRAAALVPLLLLDEEDSLFSPLSPLAASVAGTIGCGRGSPPPGDPEPTPAGQGGSGSRGRSASAARRCWAIDVSPETGPDLRLHLDAETYLVRAAEITVDSIEALVPGPDVERARREARRRPRAGAEAARLAVRYQLESDPTLAATTAWRPPATARLAPGTDTGAALRFEAGAESIPSIEPDQDRGLVFTEEIEVRLSTVTVRVLDAAGRPIRDLGPADFAVQVGGEPARVESVDWVAPSSERFSPEELTELARSGATVPPAGRLIVVFVQADLHPSRAPGHLRLLPEIRKLLATIHPEDEIAVVSFDSHLKLRQDFTRDPELVEGAIWRGIRTGRQREAEPGRFPSLAKHLDFEAARRAASPERALRVVAEALLPLPGEKILVFAGWGLGRYSADGVHMLPEYHETREALARARVTVFVLDVTQADFHSLEVGLETIAQDTGGTYEKTFRQPAQMTQRLARALEGHYEIAFSAPAGLEKAGKVRVELVGRRGQVLLRPTRPGR
ncbi:MAG TPA: VWA domain-containing protein [Thermoanaerobaculia bacterium]|nr:VWA domain-containing protein [Thermoanaerobaculia bacterium]